VHLQSIRHYLIYSAVSHTEIKLLQLRRPPKEAVMHMPPAVRSCGEQSVFISGRHTREE